jgi:hypothetical protein
MAQTRGIRVEVFICHLSIDQQQRSVEAKKQQEAFDHINVSRAKHCQVPGQLVVGDVDAA